MALRAPTDQHTFALDSEYLKLEKCTVQQNISILNGVSLQKSVSEETLHKACSCIPYGLTRMQHSQLTDRQALTTAGLAVHPNL